MSAFTRSFDTDAFKKWYARNPDSAVHELFRRWALPGSPASGDTCLRLAVRGGYLNFYVKGQSVAKLTCSSNGPTIAVHQAYVDGRMKGTDQSGSQPAQTYVEYGAETLCESGTASLVAGWVRTAESYASAEKRFVDDLVAANPGTIDLEMALPASDLPGSEKVAPRMDLVVIQSPEGADLSIAFWEAKCANNSEVRAKGDADPKVRGQLSRYVDWMGEPGRVGQVQEAYCEAATVLMALHELTKQNGNPGCLRYWQALAATKTPHIVVQPGIVIGNYWPQGSNEGIASGRMRQCAATFEKNCHRAKLEQAGIFVHQVGPEHDDPTLPHLGVDRLAA